MVTGPTRSAPAGRAESEHNHYTRLKAGRSKQGEKSINGRGSTSSSTGQADITAHTQHCKQQVALPHTHPTYPQRSTARQLRTGH
jgi:hypothetical protein